MGWKDELDAIAAPNHTALEGVTFGKGETMPETKEAPKATRKEAPKATPKRKATAAKRNAVRTPKAKKAAPKRKPQYPYPHPGDIPGAHQGALE